MDRQRPDSTHCAPLRYVTMQATPARQRLTVAALAQTTRLKDGNGRISSDAEDALVWLDDAISPRTQVARDLSVTFSYIITTYSPDRIEVSRLASTTSHSTTEIKHRVSRACRARERGSGKEPGKIAIQARLTLNVTEAIAQFWP